MEMAEKIKMLRSKHGLTLEEVGNIVGVGKSTVRKWENGEIANMRRDKIAKLAEALKTTPAYLMGWDEEKENNTDNQQQKLLSNYAKLDNDDQNKLVDYSEELVNSDKYKEEFILGVAARNGAPPKKLTREQYEAAMKAIADLENKPKKKLPEGLV